MKLSAHVLATTVLCVTSSMVLLSSRPLPAQQPVLNDVYDILEGRTMLLSQDDIGLYKTTIPNSEYGYLSQLEFHNTSDSSIQSATNGAVAANNYANFPSYDPSSTISSVAAGRMFNNGNDVLVTISPEGQTFPTELCGSPKWIYNYYNPRTTSEQTYCLNANAIDANAPKIETKAVMGNFRGDNLVEPLIFVEADYGNHQNWQMNIVSVSNPNQVDSILGNGGSTPFVRATNGASVTPLASTFVTGDFNGDGIDEIAVLLGDMKTVRIFKVDPQSLAITALQTVSLPQALPNGTLAAGRFLADGKVYLAAIGEGSSVAQEIVDFINIENAGQPVISTNYQVPDRSANVYSNTFAQAAPVVNWNGIASQQLVLAMGYNYGSTHTVEVGTFDSGGTFLLQSSTWYDGCLFGMTVGNFNRISSGSTGFDNNLDPNFQVATYHNDNQGAQCTPPYHNGQIQLSILNLNVPSGTPPSFQAGQPAPTVSNWLTTASTVAPNIGAYEALQSISLLSADFEGRSLRLGSPERTRITEHIQPTLILEQPPMFVDYVKPEQISDCTPGTYDAVKQLCVLNVSAQPHGSASTQETPGFSSSYESGSSSQKSTNNGSTTSWSISYMDTRDAKLKIGQEGVATASASLKLSVGYVHNGVADKYKTTLSQQTSSIKSVTFEDDLLTFSSNNLNVYHYPILGQLDSEGRQEYASFSVPTHVTNYDVSARTQNWYQPVHERYNPLSYPANQTMLNEQYASGKIRLLAGSQCTGSHAGGGMQTATWINGSGTNNSTGWSNGVSGDLSASVGFKVTPSVITGGLGGHAKETVDVSGSGLFQNLTQSTTELTSTQQVGVQIIPLPDNNSDYNYGFTHYVFGLASNVQPFQNPQSLLPSDLAVASNGPMYTNFTATTSGPCGSSSGSWWRETYATADVGLNHPQRWDVNTENVATFNPMRIAKGDKTTRVVDQAGLRMKGFFITTSDPKTGANMNVSEVPAGQKLYLSVRVYNYSLVGTNHKDPQTEVHVRIYAQQYCDLDLCGPSVLVPSPITGGDAVLASLPGHEPDPTETSPQPNWSLVTVPLDTAMLYKQGSRWSFWVVTWLEDKATHQVQTEVPDHGIDLTTTEYGRSFAGKVFTRVADVPLEEHSNNLGVYGTGAPALTLDEPVTGGTAEAPAALLRVASTAPTASAAGQMVRDVSLETGSATLFNVDNSISANLRAAKGAPFPGGTLQVFDGDPAQGGALVDTLRVPQITANDALRVRFNFRPQSCGAHQVYALLSSEGLSDAAARLTLPVTIDAAPTYTRAMAAVQQADLTMALKKTMLVQLQAALQSQAGGDDAAAFQTLENFKLLLRKAPAAERPMLIKAFGEVVGSANQVRACHVAR